MAQQNEKREREANSVKALEQQNACAHETGSKIGIKSAKAGDAYEL